MKKKIIGTILILIVYSIFITHLKTSKFDLAQTIGTVIGLLLFPGILATILNYLIGKFSKSGNNKWFTYFIILVVIFTLSNLISTLNNKNQPDSISQSSNKLKNEEKFFYSPSNSDFRIEFPRTPNKSITHFFINSEKIEGEMMELTTENPETYYRVEFLTNEIIEKLNENDIIQKLNELAYSEGMSNPKFDSNKKSYGEEYNLRMSKNLENSNQKSEPIIYNVKLIKMNNKIIIITTACQSKFYPTSNISEFHNSFEINL